VREALFDILGTRVRGGAFLDAFAGTGAVGIEALSRGAARAVFLERDRRMQRLIARNLQTGDWQGRSELIPGDAAASIARLAARGDSFAIVFLDPPYEHPPGPELLEACGRLLQRDGLLVVEHRAARPLAGPAHGAPVPVRTYRYGDTALSTFAPPAGPGTKR
jgi:16S rRNA (guanine(966)-N(2))-methyltransferase RsmD